jgi:hypothetical protein
MEEVFYVVLVGIFLIELIFLGIFKVGDYFERRKEGKQP